MAPRICGSVNPANLKPDVWEPAYKLYNPDLPKTRIVMCSSHCGKLAAYSLKAKWRSVQGRHQTRHFCNDCAALLPETLRPHG